MKTSEGKTENTIVSGGKLKEEAEKDEKMRVSQVTLCGRRAINFSSVLGKQNR